MRLKLACYLCASMFLLARNAGTQEQQERSVQVIQMTAKKYEYSPSPLHVRLGTKVQLKITAIDRDHGFKIATVPAGADPTAPAGLEIASPEYRDGWRLRKGEQTTIEFVAHTAGEYEFRCSVTCGLGHGGMKGQFFVDP